MNPSALAALITPLAAMLLSLMTLVLLLKERRAETLTLAAGLFLLAVIQILDPLILWNPRVNLSLKRAVLCPNSR